MKEKNFIQMAQLYISRGFSVIPLKHKSKEPLKNWKEYQTRRASIEEIESWVKSYGNINLGIVTGEISGITVFDFDSNDGVEFARSKNLLTTPLVRTSRGLHAYYKYAHGVKNAQRVDGLIDCDIRNDGGYVVAPPSIHSSGEQYCWVGGNSLQEKALSEFPRLINQDNGIVDLMSGVSIGERTEAALKISGVLIGQRKSKESVVEILLGWNRKCLPPQEENNVVKIVDDVWKRHYREDFAFSENPREMEESSDDNFFFVDSGEFVPIAAGKYLAELVSVQSNFGNFGKRFEFDFRIVKDAAGSEFFKDASITAFVNYPKSKKLRGDSKLLKWAEVLINKKFRNKTKFDPKSLIGNQCWIDVALDGRTNRIKEIYSV